MIKIILNTLNILNTNQKLRLVFVSMASIITGLLEMLSIALFIPLVGLIIDKTFLENFAYLNNILIFFSGFINIEIFYILIFLLVIIFIIKNISISILNFYSDKSAYNTRKEIGNKIMSNYLNNRYEVYQSQNSSVILYILSEEIARFGHMLLSITRLFTNILIALFILGFIFYNYPSQLLLISAFAIIGGGLYYSLTANFISTFGKKRVLGEENYQKNLRETLDFFKEIKIYFKEKYFNQLYRSKNEVIIKNGYIWSFFQSLPKVWFELVAVFGLFAIISFNYSKSLNTQEIVISLSVVIYAIARMLPSVNIILNSIQNLKFTEYGFNKIRSLLKNNNSFENTKTIKRNHLIDFQKIQIKDISFNYPDKEEILQNINLEINKGDIIGIIGDSGSGKSTFIDLLIGLLNFKKGEIYIDSKKLSNNIYEWQDLIGYIPQKINLLDNTIKHNIILDHANIDNTKLNNAINQAGLKQFIETLPQGAETIVGERGSKLSGGQAQRIAIARALYNNPEVLILDEATNSLDLNLEENILGTLKSLKKTLIVVSHRLSTLKFCNKVYKLNNKSMVISN